MRASVGRAAARRACGAALAEGCGSGAAARRLPDEVLLRLRHPTAAAIQKVTVNGAVWKNFDAVRELMRLHGVAGRARVETVYGN